MTSDRLALLGVFLAFACHRTELAEGAVAVRMLPSLATGVSIAIDDALPGARLVTCGSGDDRWIARREAGDPPIEWYGLLVDASYTCVLQVGDATLPFTFTTPVAPDDLPTGEVFGKTTGYTIYNEAEDRVVDKLAIVDPLGRTRWYHYLSGNPNTDIEAAFLPETSRGPQILAAGGEGMPPTLLALDGTVTWAGPPVGIEGGNWNHDVLWHPEDETAVSLTGTSDQGGGRTWDGFAVEQIAAWTGARAWSWNSQTAYDRGELAPADEEDAYHANAIEWHEDDPDGPAYWISVKRLHQIVRLDQQTGDVTWRLGVGGDFQLLEEDGTPADDSRWFYGQHAPEGHPTDDPDVWIEYVHDNGMDRPVEGEVFTRALALELDLRAKTARITWEFTEPGWYEPIYGDVDLLPDGHVLVAEAHCPQCDGALPRNTEFVEVDPATNDVSWRFVLDEMLDAGYRASRIDACALFPENATYCADAAAALDGSDTAP